MRRLPTVLLGTSGYGVPGVGGLPPAPPGSGAPPFDGGIAPPPPPGGSDTRNAYVASDGKVYRCGAQTGRLPGSRRPVEDRPVVDDGRREPVRGAGTRTPPPRRSTPPPRTLGEAASPCPPNGSPPPTATPDGSDGLVSTDDLTSADETPGSPPGSPGASSDTSPTVWLAFGAAAFLLVLSLR